MSCLRHQPGRRLAIQHLFMTGVGAGMGVVSGSVRAADAVLPQSRSLAGELALAQKRGQPLIVMVSLHGCPFCEVVRNSHLAPLLRVGMPVVQVDMRSRTMTENFSGVAASHEQMIRSWNVQVAPTVLFFGKNGREIADRMEGGYLPDFYGSYLDDRLLAARGRF